MKIKAGKFTLAFTLILCGILMLINSAYGNNMFQDLWMYSPAVLILFGLEIVVLSLIYWNKPEYKVTASFGSVILIIVVIALFMTWTNPVEFHDPFFDQFFNFRFSLNF